MTGSPINIQTRSLNEAQDLIEVILKGRLDIQSSEAIRTQLHTVIKTEISRLIVNLEEVYFIDSAGLSALVSGLRVARENNKDIILVGLNKQAEMVFKLTMLDRVFIIHPTLERALEALAG